MRWHDVPLAATLAAGGEYDITIVWQNVTTWRWWSDIGGLPYTVAGTITVRNSEANGDPTNFALINMDVYACDEALTPIDDKDPTRTPMFLATPAPNPVSSMSRLDFALEEDGPVSIVVYNVAGQRVTTLLDGQRPKGWHSVDLDSGNLASGVYFLKMQTKMKSV
jgi:type IX secretion system substrate protein